MPDEEKTQLQDADLHTTDGRVERVRLPAFPNNPDFVAVAVGVLTLRLTGTRYFVPSNPVIGYGPTILQYHEVDVYELGGSDA